MLARLSSNSNVFAKHLIVHPGLPTSIYGDPQCLSTVNSQPLFLSSRDSVFFIKFASFSVQASRSLKLSIKLNTACYDTF